MAKNPGVHFQEVYDNYIAGLPTKSKKKHFIGEIEVNSRNSSIDDLRKSVHTLVEKCADRKLQRWLVRFLVPVAMQIKEYSAALDQIITPQPAKIVWGGLRIVADCLVRYASTMENIEAVLTTLNDHLWALTTCDRLYADSVHSAPTVQRIVGKSYTHIIDLWYKVTKEVRRHPLISLGRQVWRDDKILGALSAIKEDADVLHRISSIAEAELASHTRDAVFNIKHELDVYQAGRQVEMIAVHEERKLADAHRQKVEAELKALKEKSQDAELNQRADQTDRLVESLREDHSHEANLLHKFTQGRYPGTCQWLFKLPQYQSWLSESCATPLLWLHGNHGSGKSFVCSAAINEMKGNPDALCTAYFFITKGKEVSRTTLLRSLAYQLVKSIQARIGIIAEDTISLIRSSAMEPFHFEQIISRVLMDIPFMCVYIDGLDEVTDPRELESVLRFLKDECRQRKGRLRLWLSSQYSLGLEDCIRRDSKDIVIEVQIQEQYTNSDIKRYLEHELPDSVQNADALSKLIITQSLNGDAKGSFLWVARMMQDLKQRAESSEDMLRLARKGLPSSMHDYYKAVIARYRGRQSFDTPLWRIILSILAFARRPMRLHEIREAIAIARSESDRDIRPTNLIFVDKVIAECSELVDCLKSGKESEDRTMVLSHLAVYNFLRSHAGSADNSCDHRDCAHTEPIVSEEILRDICVRYLLQPRYSQLLHKHDPSRFTSKDGSDLRDHRLALYAAKYWYRHCGEVIVNEEGAPGVSRFLRSTNFRTCLQIQSIAIIGHFAINYDPVNGSPTTMLRNLPTCIGQYEKALEQQYNFFLREWCHVLQLGLTPQLSGQVDRVLWSGLGRNNFLSNGQCRYTCFQLGDDQTGTSTCKMLFPLQQESDQCVFELKRMRDVVEVSASCWHIDSCGPKLISQKKHNIKVEPQTYDTVGSTCASRYGIIPETRTSTRPGFFRFLDNGKVLAVGSQVFYQMTPAQEFVQIETGEQGVFEEACQSSSVVVLCRRKRPKTNAEHDEQDEQQQVGRKKRSKHRQVDREEHHSSTDDDDEDDNSEADTASLHSGGSQAVSDPDLIASDAESIDADSFDAGDRSSESDSSESLQSGTEDDSTSNHSDLELASDEDSSLSELSSLVSGSDDMMSEDDTEGSDDETAKKENPGFCYPVSIKTEERDVICDGCEKRLRSCWFACKDCEPEQGFDLCPNCVWNEQKWCRDKHHQMYHFVHNKVIGVVSWDNSIIQQELKVFKIGSPDPIFTFQEGEHDMLHESPPCLHPSLPIVAWPVRQERLLLADYSRDVYKVHAVRCSSRRARNIATSVNFSADGRRLYVAALEAARVYDKRNKTRSLRQNYFELSLTVTTLLLDREAPCKRRPQVLQRQHHVIDIWKRPHFNQMPWTWTWTPDRVYLTINGLSLHLFKIELSANKCGIFVPSEVVFLPHSAQDRSIRYFQPQLGGDRSLLVIGPHNAREPQPPLAVYLKPEDLGPWLNVKDVPVDHSKKYKLKMRPDFEMFDAEYDCDVKPFDVDA